MARPSLTAALARLAELRDLRQKLVVTRLRLVAGTDRDRSERLAEIEADRLAIDETIREAKATIIALRLKHDGPRVAKPRPAVTRVSQLRRVVARA